MLSSLILGMFAYLMLLCVLALPYLAYLPAIRKAGFSGWWVLAMLIPVVGVLFVWAFAYSPWPAHPDR